MFLFKWKSDITNLVMYKNKVKSTYLVSLFSYLTTAKNLRIHKFLLINITFFFSVLANCISSQVWIYLKNQIKGIVFHLELLIWRWRTNRGRKIQEYILLKTNQNKMTTTTTKCERIEPICIQQAKKGAQKLTKSKMFSRAVSSV